MQVVPRHALDRLGHDGGPRGRRLSGRRAATHTAACTAAATGTGTAAATAAATTAATATAERRRDARRRWRGAELQHLHGAHRTDRAHQLARVERAAAAHAVGGECEACECVGHVGVELGHAQPRRQLGSGRVRGGGGGGLQLAEQLRVVEEQHGVAVLLHEGEAQRAVVC